MKSVKKLNEKKDEYFHFDDPLQNENTFYNNHGEWGHVKTGVERSILGDLKPYDFHDEIKNKADTIFSKMLYQVRRKKIRTQMLFYCVYCAYMELGRPINPIELGSIFGLTQGDVQKCDSIFSPLQTGYRPPIKPVSPISYLSKYCENIGLSMEAAEEIEFIGNNILKKDPDLLQENPQTVAAGILKYYIVTNGIFIEDTTTIKRITNRSNATIDSIYKKIGLIDNQ